MNERPGTYPEKNRELRWKDVFQNLLISVYAVICRCARRNFATFIGVCFTYEATDKLIRFTDYKDIKYRSRTVFSFFQPQTLQDLLEQPDTIRNNMKHFPAFDTTLSFS